MKEIYTQKCSSLNRVKNNLSGKNWFESFMKRNNLTKRVADNVEISSPIVNSDIINNYFDNLKEEIGDIPPQCLLNYDETNITDDPGVKHVIVSRGYGRRVERKQEHSKQSTSVMFCGWKCRWKVCTTNGSVQSLQSISRVD